MVGSNVGIIDEGQRELFTLIAIHYYKTRRFNNIFIFKNTAFALFPSKMFV